MNIPTSFIWLYVLAMMITILRVMLRPHRESTPRIAWIAVITTLPVLGVPAYLFFAEENIGHKHIAGVNWTN